MEKKQSKIIYIALAALLALLIIFAVVIVIVNRNHQAAVDSLGDDYEQLQDDGEKKSQTIDSLTGTKASLEKQVVQLKSEISGLNEKVAKLESDFANAGTVYADEISSLKAQIQAKNNEIASLEADIARYETVYTIDVRAQAQLIDEIIEYMDTQCPFVRMNDTIETDKNGEEIITYKWVAVADLIDEERLKAEESGEIEKHETDKPELDEAEYALLLDRVLAREDVFYPHVSVYYEDLVTGYHFGYNDDYTYNSASVIKAPYILSVLENVSADEQNYLAALEAEEKAPELTDADGDGTPETPVIEYSDPNYSLTDTVVYNRATMFKQGSGKIQEMEDGTEFSYLDFIKYALEYSDNIAYQQLRNRFGFKLMYTLARRVGASSVLKDGNNMTAHDAGKLFKAIYEFTESDEKYGPMMAESMAAGNHTVIIPYGVSPTKVLHKYGWDTDSYHDAAVVLYGDKPYILTVFSDLDKGGDEINAFLRGIVKKINTLHKNFYK